MTIFARSDVFFFSKELSLGVEEYEQHHPDDYFRSYFLTEITESVRSGFPW